MRKAKITPTMERFIEGLAMGMKDIEAARYTGVSCPERWLEDNRNKPWIQQEATKVKALIAEEKTLTKQAVQQIVMEAIDMAKILADPTAMIRGAQELNKMQGYYAEEKKRLEVSGTVEHVQRQLERMPATELLRALGEELDPLEAEFEVLNAPKQLAQG